MKVNPLGKSNVSNFGAKLSPKTQELASSTMYELRESGHKLGQNILQNALKQIDSCMPQSTMSVERIFVDGRPRYEAFVKSKHIAEKHLDIRDKVQDINDPLNIADTFKEWSKALKKVHEKVKDILD